ncbi:B12-binding domain-containing radical SAM protein [Patescibacteria group bacterium]
MKILFISPPFYRLQEATLIHYPAGPCYMAGSLEKEGYPSLVYNADYDCRKKTILGNTNHLRTDALVKQHEEYLGRLNDLNDPVWIEVRNFIKDYNPDVLGISAFNITLSSAHIVAKIAKSINPNIITIMEGCNNRGIFCAIDPAEVADFNIIDFAISREPEITIVELIKAFDEKKTDFSDIDGLTWKKDDKIIRNRNREFLEDLDQLPFPARHLIYDYDKMAPHVFQGIYGSRGCPFNCVFCGCHVSCGYKPRTRSAKNMVDEIEYVYKRFKTHYFYVCDDIFFIDKERAKEFCNRLIEKNLKITWSCQSRAEMLDDEILALVKKAGGQHIAVGVETGNEKVRALMKKGNTLDDVRKCAKLIKKHKLYMVAFCIVGLPWESEMEIQDTVNFIEEINPYIVYPYLATPAPGTELDRIIHEDHPDSKKILKDLCHSNPAEALSRYIPSGKKVIVINKALARFADFNKKSLLKNFFERPKFYWYFINDINLFKNPRHIISYIWDYFCQ